MKPVKNRFFFYTLAIPAFVAMVVNFSIASNLGWTPIDVEWRRTDDEVAGINRQIWYVRYIGWFLIWPILTVAILLTSVVPTLYILWTCFLTASMAVLATVGALVLRLAPGRLPPDLASPQVRQYSRLGRLPHPQCLLRPPLGPLRLVSYLLGCF